MTPSVLVKYIALDLWNRVTVLNSLHDDMGNLTSLLQLYNQLLREGSMRFRLPLVQIVSLDKEVRLGRFLTSF